MSNGSIYFLQQNPEFRIIVENIQGHNEHSTSALFVPFRIQFSNLYINQTALSKVVITGMKAVLHTRGKFTYCSETINLAPGTWLQPHSLAINPQLKFMISQESLHRIEKERVNNIEFHVELKIQAALYSTLSLSNGQEMEFVRDMEIASGDANFTIPQSRWVNDLLPQMGYDAIRILEIPVSSPVLPVEYAGAIQELEKAKQSFMIGGYDQAVGYCRIAIEPLKMKYFELKKHITSDSEADWGRKTIDATIEWIDKMLRSTASYASKSHHYPSGGHFNKATAEIILMTTVSILAFVGRITETSNH